MTYLEAKFTDEELKSVHDLASANFSPEKIAKYLDREKDYFLKIWYDKTSEVRMNYDRGMLQSEFEIINKQNELAKTGNITSAQIFLKESEKQKTENLRNQILFGHE